MGKGSLREYMSDIARSNAEGSSGGGGDSDFNFLEYVTDLKNVATIKFKSSGSDTEIINVDEQTNIIVINSDVSQCEGIEIIYKNGIKFADFENENSIYFCSSTIDEDVYGLFGAYSTKKHIYSIIITLNGDFVSQITLAN